MSEHRRFTGEGVKITAEVRRDANYPHDRVLEIFFAAGSEVDLVLKIHLDDDGTLPRGRLTHALRGMADGLDRRFP